MPRVEQPEQSGDRITAAGRGAAIAAPVLISIQEHLPVTDSGKHVFGSRGLLPHTGGAGNVLNSFGAYPTWMELTVLSGRSG